MPRLRVSPLILASFLGVLLACGGSSPKASDKKPDILTPAKSSDLEQDIVISAKEAATACEEFNILATAALKLHVEYSPSDFESLRAKAVNSIATHLKQEAAEPDLKTCKDIEAIVAAIPDSKKVDPYALLASAFFSALDPHSSYVSSKTRDEWYKEAFGKQLTSGILVEARRGHTWVPPKRWRVFYVHRDSSAYGRIQPGQEITAIDNISIRDMNLLDLGKLLIPEGSAGSHHDILRFILKGLSAPVDVELKELRYPSVLGRLIPNPKAPLGLIRVREFSEHSAEEFRTVLKALEPEVEGWILDIRHNPGGDPSKAVEMVDALVDAGPQMILTSKFKPEVLEATTPGSLSDKPVVLLTDSGTASAADSLAGMLRRKRAVHIGETTYGKGTGFVVLNVKGQHFKGVALVTTIRLYAPDGSSAQGKGYTPHLTLKDPVMDEALALRASGQASFVYRESEYPHVLPDRPLPSELVTEAADTTIPSTLEDINAEQLVTKVQRDCTWETQDCQRILAERVLEQMIDAGLRF